MHSVSHALFENIHFIKSVTNKVKESFLKQFLAPLRKILVFQGPRWERCTRVGCTGKRSTTAKGERSMIRKLLRLSKEYTFNMPIQLVCNMHITVHAVNARFHNTGFASHVRLEPLAKLMPIK